MSDDNSGRRHAKWEPGTLDATRRNIGPIDREEAAKMTKILGGEIIKEKSAPIDYSSLPIKRNHAQRASGKTGADVARSSASGKEKKGNKYGYATGGGKEKKAEPALPNIDPRENMLIDKLMMQDEYKIKQNLGIFNFIRKFKKNGTELVRRDFVEFTLNAHIEHINGFITSVQSLIQISPDSYKTDIVNSNELKFKLLRTVGSWNTKNLKTLAADVQSNSDSVTVAMMIPFTKAIYKDLIKIYYIGENVIPKLFKEIHNDLLKYPLSNRKKISSYSRQSVSEWFYIYTKIIKGMYPLLMRMCSKKFNFFQDFFMAETANIFSFLEITKFDLILPGKNNEKEQQKPQDASADSPQETDQTSSEAQESSQKTQETKPKLDAVVEAGLQLLDKLFPGAGFLKLDTFPDMYPYFQPLYQFRDGFNLLSEQNPMQITIVLLRITEDLFQGCRNISFADDLPEMNPNNPLSKKSEAGNRDSFSAAINEWSVYREELFEKLYCDNLKALVNQEYSQSDFVSTLFGKRLITTLLWQTKYNFLPHFEFEQLLLEKPQNDSQYRPLCIKVDFLRNKLVSYANAIDSAISKRAAVPEINNLWSRYEFDIPTVISKRMDVLLSAKRPLAETNATNANLLKYTYCIVTVLDWWINSKESPAYSADSSKIYRISEEDGAPLFSVPVRTDQNKLFAAKVKSIAAANKQAHQAHLAEQAAAQVEKTVSASAQS